MWAAMAGAAWSGDDAAYGPWSAPERLSAAVNLPEADEQHPAISKNGLSLYFSSNRAGGMAGNNPDANARFDLYVARRTDRDAPWEPPDNLGAAVNSDTRDMAPNFTPDGHWMYFHSSRPGGCNAIANNPAFNDLWRSHRKRKSDDLGWETPENLGCVVNSEFNDAGPTFVARDEDDGEAVQLYFTRDTGGPTGFDIYVSTLDGDGTFGPGQLVPELSSPFRDTRTTIRRDGLEMLISTERPRPDGLTDNRDIWVSTRSTTADPWGTPVPVETINSVCMDGAPALSFDGTELYFFSMRPDTPGTPCRTKADLFVARRSKLSD
jgi:hypothetical protein